MVSLLSEAEEKYGIKITFSVESEPLDTGANELHLLDLNHVF